MVKVPVAVNASSCGGGPKPTIHDFKGQPVQPGSMRHMNESPGLAHAVIRAGHPGNEFNATFSLGDVKMQEKTWR
jgi:hypothetical protein